MERAPTGIPVLDKILEGGIPRPASVLITGDIGTNKNTFAQQIMYKGLLNGEKAIYVTVDAFPRDLIANMLKYKMNVKPFVDRGDLVFIDGFSPRVGVESDAQYIIENPFDPNEILKTIVIAEKEVFTGQKSCRLVFSHISTVLFMARKSQILSFIERLHAEARKYNGIYILVYSEGVRSPYIENFIKQLPDVVITLKRDPISGKRTLSITRCIRTRYPRNSFEYELTDHGIEVKEPEKLVY
ncbi:hypothetical protein J4526_01740 [Desulfurococcaceae archaeon MEX13E-LK6-19]|nr:hypothetical protein J4526_01740 [Desulfurococcaceae archaeon MEX13E-LK6-19]